MRVVGLDIGYGNIKIAEGWRGEQPRVHTRPSGAAPAHLMTSRIEGVGVGGSDKEGGAIPVEVDGQPWIAGVEPSRFEAGWSRPLHEDYSTTNTYRALALAGLVLADAPVIDLVVTGLPVSQATDPARIEAITQMLVGRHARDQGDILVKEVRVIPQPIGAYVDFLRASTDPTLRERILAGVTLVLDAGFYSLDWAVLDAGALRRGASGTSLEAASVLLERAARIAAERAGGRAAMTNIEAAVRAGRTHIMQAGSRLPVGELIGAAAQEIAPVAFESLRQALRRESRTVDLVLVTGGAGSWYAGVVQDLFPRAEIIHQEEPVSANARGFFRYGR